MLRNPQLLQPPPAAPAQHSRGMRGEARTAHGHGAGRALTATWAPFHTPRYTLPKEPAPMRGPSSTSPQGCVRLIALRTMLDAALSRLLARTGSSPLSATCAQRALRTRSAGCTMACQP